MNNLQPDPLEALGELVRTHRGEPPLDRAMVEVARVDRPEVDGTKVLEELDRLAERVKQEPSNDGQLPAIRRVLFIEEGFRGHRDQYYEPENSLIDLVLERRRGIPITLAVIWLEVARRVGATAEGVGFPGHFLVRHFAGDVWRYLDVFEGGRLLEPGDAERILTSVHGPKAQLQPSMLDAVSNGAILVRVCQNLKNAHALAKDHLGVVRAIDRLLAIEPDLHTERRDRGLTYAGMGLAKAAIADLSDYLRDAQVPREERQMLERMLPDLELRANQMN